MPIPTLDELKQQAIGLRMCSGSVSVTVEDGPYRVTSTNTGALIVSINEDKSTWPTR